MYIYIYINNITYDIDLVSKSATRPRMSLWAVPPVLAVEEEAELLPGSRDEFIVQVGAIYRE